MTWSDVLRHRQMRDTDAPLLFSFTGATRLVPLLAGAGLFAVTIVVSLIGPIDWQLDNPAKVYAFLLACLVAMCAGYLWAVRRQPEPLFATGGARLSASSILVVGALVYLVLYPLTVYNSTGNWYPDVVGGLTDPGRAYAEKTAAELEIPQVATYLGMLVAPLTIGILPLTLFFWPRISRLARTLGVITTLLSLALGVSRAVNQDVGEIAGYLVLFLVLVASTSTQHTRSRWRRVAACVAGAALVTGAFLAYYSSTLSGRVAADVEASDSPEKESIDDAMTSTALASFGEERSDSVFFTVVPPVAQPTGTLLSSYLTQGYKGLSLAMDSPWEPTYGLGFSSFVRHNVARVAGLDEDAIEARSYEGQIDEVGWVAGVQWSTFFVHPASDVSFVGVVPLMALFGLAFGLAWRDMCRRRDPLACIVFFYLGIQVLYLSANNQLYQGGQLAIGFTVVLIAWLVLRRRLDRDADEAEVHASAESA
ncbi:hypothetical protein SAMN04489844_1208 [Nocardioides exalbidus]|uniref:Oligosaccharide repeat unit polymerase n=1 Tax=Nocardioides exalbidus TaxID=402596 RepID=A0A1H4MU32_9ACTN|nr:hypothetical protein [Nocardioides exalbidus]SEB86035.1 hypothetical protein SAMN04489844_1208 [Nocardioides exalbidus]